VRFEQPPSALVERLSPTSYEVLGSCRLRYSFGQQPGAGTFRGTPAARLGTICHQVLDEAVRGAVFETDGWREEIEQLWDRALAAEETNAAADGVTEEARRWPGYQLKRARLFHVAGRLREFLGVLPRDAQLLVEQPLTAADGRLYGRPDLVIRSPGQHQIIDYKSGGVIDRDSKQPREVYVRQLQLYAFLEHEASGEWPATAHLVPLQGSPVEIDVDPDACTGLATQALQALDAYNDSVPATQPASPTPENCRWCSYPIICSAFWDRCDEAWAPAIAAAAGVVTHAFATPLGGMTAELQVTAGSLAEPSIVIKNIDASEHVDAARLAPGVEVAAVGLVADQRGTGYWLGNASGIAVTQPDP